MAEELKVYLDHLIRREDLLYQRSEDVAINESEEFNNPRFTLKDFFTTDDPVSDRLRKPDFQRATWAWTPEECVSLLHSLLHKQVVPSVIMWKSPSSFYYVLDGGHRISVLLAWLNNDWGDSKSGEVAEYDPELAKKIRDAAREVRRLLAGRNIGNFKDYKLAYTNYKAKVNENTKIEPELDPVTDKQVQFYRALLDNNGFHLQWVAGNYQKAEESFLNINKSGTKLTEWETLLVNYRKSSLSRFIMSVSNITGMEHCWPTKLANSEDKAKATNSTTAILSGITKLNDYMF